MAAETFSVSEWAALIQAMGAIFTTVGVVASLYLSVRALREVQADRRQRQAPYVQFEQGGYRYPVRFVKGGKRIPGINPAYAEACFPELDDEAESVQLVSARHGEPVGIGQMKNFGSGPAFSVKVIWIPQRVVIKSEAFEIDDAKREEPLYSAALNTLPSFPSHLMPGDESGLTRLPTFIVKDVDRKLSRVDGVLKINALDTFGRWHETTQRFIIFPKYNEEPPKVHITFSKVLPAESLDS